MAGRKRSALLALALMGATQAVLAQGKSPGTDWLGNPLPQEESFGRQPDDSLDPFEDRSIPSAYELKGERPLAKPELQDPPATSLSPDVDRLAAPASLALPNQPSQVRIKDLRPLTLTQAVEIMEVNNPFLKAIAMKVEEAKSNLRAEISRWYPTVNLQAQPFPGRTAGTNYQNYGKSSAVSKTNQEQQFQEQQQRNQLDGLPGTPRSFDRFGEWWGTTQTYAADASINLGWNLIDPQRVPAVAAALQKSVSEPEEAHSFAPQIEIASMMHEMDEMRLFMN